MSTSPVDHGQIFKDLGNLNVQSLAGAFTMGQFTVTAAAVTTITDTSITGNHTIIVVPSNGPAGLLLASKSCFVTTGVGSFTFNVSATGAGAPAGTEILNYLAMSKTVI